MSGILSLPLTIPALDTRPRGAVPLTERPAPTIQPTGESMHALAVKRQADPPAIDPLAVKQAAMPDATQPTQPLRSSPSGPGRGSTPNATSGY